MTDEDDDLAEEDFVLHNPYFLQPTLRDVVEWLGGRALSRGGSGKSSTSSFTDAADAAIQMALTLAHLQQAMAKCCWRPEPVKQKGKANNSSKRNMMLLMPDASMFVAGSREARDLTGLSMTDLIRVDQVVLKNANFRADNEENGVDG